MSKLHATPIDELSENLAEHIDEQFFRVRDPIVIMNTIRLLIIRNFLGEEAIQSLIKDLTIALQIYAKIACQSSGYSSD
jgi:hypothetical protein